MKLDNNTEAILRIPNLTWAYADAMNIAMDMLDHHEITLAELDSTVKELWDEMMSDNGEA